MILWRRSAQAAGKKQRRLCTISEKWKLMLATVWSRASSRSKVGFFVAIGDPKLPTPQWVFAILTKKVNPIYVSNKSEQRNQLSCPTSPIGDRYLAFHSNGRGEFGIHAAPWPHWVKICAALSLCCVHMLNYHLLQLFELVDVGNSLEIRGSAPLITQLLRPHCLRLISRQACWLYRPVIGLRLP